MPFVHDMQITLPGLGPTVGDRWRNRNTGNIAVIIGLAQHQHDWATIRTNGNEQTLKISALLRNFERI